MHSQLKVAEITPDTIWSQLSAVDRLEAYLQLLEQTPTSRNLLDASYETMSEIAAAAENSDEPETAKFCSGVVQMLGSMVHGAHNSNKDRIAFLLNCSDYVKAVILKPLNKNMAESEGLSTRREALDLRLRVHLDSAS